MEQYRNSGNNAKDNQSLKWYDCFRSKVRANRGVKAWSCPTRLHRAHACGSWLRRCPIMFTFHILGIDFNIVKNVVLEIGLQKGRTFVHYAKGTSRLRCQFIVIAWCYYLLAVNDCLFRFDSIGSIAIRRVCSLVFRAKVVDIGHSFVSLISVLCRTSHRW